MPKAIIFIGLQASGKSTYYHQILQNDYVHINLDSLHTRNKERLLIEECFTAGYSFVVDNTNPTAADRERYISAARQYGYEVEGYFFQSVIAACVERNHLRSGKACVPDKAIAATSNRMELPSYQEGFDKLYFVRIAQGMFITEEWNDKDGK
jgi:predicted kinase